MLSCSHYKVTSSDSNCFDFDILKGRIFQLLWKKVIIPYLGIKDRIFSDTGKRLNFPEFYVVFSWLRMVSYVPGITSSVIILVHQILKFVSPILP